MRRQVSRVNMRSTKTTLRGTDKFHAVIKMYSQYDHKTQDYNLLYPPPPLILLHCRFSNSLHIARSSFSYLPESLGGRTRNEKRKFKTQKYSFKFRETCMGESGTDKLPEIAILRNQSKSK